MPCDCSVLHVTKTGVTVVEMRIFRLKVVQFSVHFLCILAQVKQD